MPSYSYAANFYEQRYRGWLWFEDKEKLDTLKEEQEKLVAKEKKEEEYVTARKEVEQFSKELEELKFMMIRYPENLEHARKYKEKEAEMLDNSLKLAQTFRMVNFLHPDGVDLIDNPTNLYGRRIKEEMEQKETSRKLTELSTKVELFVFFSSSCQFCQALEPVLDSFATKYGFKVEAVSLDGSNSKFFKTHQDKELATMLNLQKAPTVVLVTNDSKIRFELIRGAASMSELEEAGIMASDYLSNIEQSSKISNRNLR